MIARTLIILSLSLNIALGVGIFYSLRTRPSTTTITHAERTTPVGLPVVTKNEAPPVQILPPDIEEKLQWSQLVSTDFKTYRDNLRAIRCPELTVRDIIMSEINEFYSQKRRVIMAQLQSQFWDLAMTKQWLTGANAFSKSLEAFSNEREEIIQQVLGKSTLQAEENKARDLERRHQSYSWLPIEKRDKMIALEDDFLRKMSEPELKLDRPLTDEEEKSQEPRRQALRQQQEDARKQLLSPEEYDEFQFRASASSRWTSGLSGFEVNEAEWRAIGKLLKKNEAELNAMQSVGPELATIQTATETEIRNAMGAERYAEYKLARDDSYQQTRRITKRYDLPDSLALQAYQMQQTAVASANEIRANSNLSPETQQAALAAIQQETQRTLNQTLGQKVFGTYQKYNGEWLQQLGQMKTSETLAGE